jgi:hypothetical protein
MIYGDPIDVKPVPAHVLEWQVEHANKREAAILARLETISEASYEAQELRS